MNDDTPTLTSLPQHECLPDPELRRLFVNVFTASANQGKDTTQCGSEASHACELYVETFHASRDTSEDATLLNSNSDAEDYFILAVARTVAARVLHNELDRKDGGLISDIINDGYITQPQAVKARAEIRDLANWFIKCAAKLDDDARNATTEILDDDADRRGS